MERRMMADADVEELEDVTEEEEEEQLPETVEEVLERIRYQNRFYRDAPEELGYKDLKSEENRQFLMGMAWAYMSAYDYEDPGDWIGTRSRTLDKIVGEILDDTKEGILWEMLNEMERVLTSMIDDEADTGES